MEKVAIIKDDRVNEIKENEELSGTKTSCYIDVFWKHVFDLRSSNEELSKVLELMIEITG